MPMDEHEIELDTVDSLGAGAVGEPGQREFFLQARTESAQLTVLVEKEQVALLAAEAVAFLNRISEDYPEADDMPEPIVRQAGLREPTVPLFRARLIGLGFDPDRELVLIELRERSSEDEEGEGSTTDTGTPEVPELPEAPGVPEIPDDPGALLESDQASAAPTEDEDDEGYVARIYATRPQVRAMAAKGAEAVAAGRPLCPLCDMPMDPAGHRCPRWN
jgi:uncharacterized repeat protein (TIGR03847 family)